MSSPAPAAPHGRLPPWGRATLPAPPAFTPRNVLRTIGPGVIALGVAIGGGEWLLGPSVIIKYGVALLWITTAAVLLQTVLNLEMARYTLYTGEPIVTGFMRTWPGPGVWGWTYSILALLQYGWPGWALTSATATAALLLGRMPTGSDAPFVILLGYATFGACLLIVSLGRKIERTLEYAMWGLIAWIFIYLVAVDITSVSASNWARIADGFLSFGAMPQNADWTLLAAFAAFSGMGGAGNVFITNWMRDKGFGMGATVGYIPTVLGGRVHLSPHGNVFNTTPENLKTWRDWWKFVHVDQWGVFTIGSLAGMGLTCLLTLQFVPAGAVAGEWAVASLQAAGMASALGPAFWYLTLFCGLWVLFSTQLGIVDGVPRAITDTLWSGSPAVRRWRGGDVRAVYYVVVAAFAVWGCIALNVARPLTLIIIGANVAGFIMVIASAHTLVVNRMLLPREVQPSRLREAALVACTLFYGSAVFVSLRALL